MIPRATLDRMLDDVEADRFLYGFTKIPGAHLADLIRDLIACRAALGKSRCPSEPGWSAQECVNEGTCECGNDERLERI